MMHLVEEDRERGQFAYLVAQLIGHAVFLVVRFVMKVKQSIRSLVNAVEYHFLGIGHGHKSEEFRQGLVYGNLLHIGVLGAV